MAYIDIMSPELQQRLRGSVVQGQRQMRVVDTVRLRYITSVDICELDNGVEL